MSYIDMTLRNSLQTKVRNDIEYPLMRHMSIQTLSLKNFNSLVTYLYSWK